MKKYLLLLCLFSVGFTGQPMYVVDQIVAVVGKKPVKLSDVEGRYLQMRAQGTPVSGDMKCSIFEEILTEKLLANQAEVDSLVVTESEVENEMSRRLNIFIAQAGSEQELEKYFRKSMYDIKDDLRRSLYEQMLAQKMQQEIVKNVTVTPTEVRDFYRQIPEDSVPLIPGKAEVAQITMYPPYSEEAISEVRQKLLDLRKRVLAGESFRTLAVLYSEEPGAARRGGEIGFQSKGELDPEYAKAAWALKNKGDVSRIVQSKFGYHLIQLVDKRGDQVSTRHILMKPRITPEAEKEAIQKMDSLVQKIRDGKITWEAAAFFSQDENTRLNGGVMINPEDRSTLFEMNQLLKSDYAVLKDMKQGDISAPFLSADDKGKPVFKIFKLKILTDPHKANMKDDYNYLMDLTRNRKMMNTIRQWVNEKIGESYIFIDDRFRRCAFGNSNWLKTE